MKNNEIRLCCGGKGCPIVKKVNAQTVEIKDDAGNRVTLSINEAKLLPKALKELDISK